MQLTFIIFIFCIICIDFVCLKNNKQQNKSACFKKKNCFHNFYDKSKWRKTRSMYIVCFVFWSLVDLFRFSFKQNILTYLYLWCHLSFSEFFFIAILRKWNSCVLTLDPKVWILWVLYILKLLFTTTAINTVFLENCHNFIRMNININFCLLSYVACLICI